MTKVAILPIPTGGGTVSYRAVAEGKHSEGRTPGEALDALTSQLSGEGEPMLVVVNRLRADRFFTASQQRRLVEMMARWRAARDHGDSLSDEEQAELEQLVDAELRASAERAAAMAEEIES